jgi:hypothetical protein
VETGLRQKCKILFKKKITKAKKDWGHGSSSRAPAKEAQGPKFKPQCCKNKQIRKIN